MKDDKDDDFMCIRLDGGKTITTFKGVTVVASKRTEKVEIQKKESVQAKSWWRRLLGR